MSATNTERGASGAPKEAETETEAKVEDKWRLLLTLRLQTAWAIALWLFS